MFGLGQKLRLVGSGIGSVFLMFYNLKPTQMYIRKFESLSQT